MTPYRKAVDELNELGYITEHTLAALTPEEALRAVEEAGYQPR